MRNCWATTAAGAWGCTADDRPVGNWTRDAGMDLERVMLGGGNKLRRVVPSAMVPLDRLGDRGTGKLRAADVCGVNEQVVSLRVFVCQCMFACTWPSSVTDDDVVAAAALVAAEPLAGCADALPRRIRRRGLVACGAGGGGAASLMEVTKERKLSAAASAVPPGVAAAVAAIPVTAITALE